MALARQMVQCAKLTQRSVIHALRSVCPADSPVYGVSIFLARVIRRELAISAHADAEFLSPCVEVIIIHRLFVISARPTFGHGVYWVVHHDLSPDYAPCIRLLGVLFTLLFFLAYFFVLPSKGWSDWLSEAVQHKFTR
jgi:hypothetical protein